MLFRSKQRVELQEQIKNLLEQTNKISNEANNLASALKGSSKKQGNWGEMILETILQHSGLQRDVHYFKEKSFNNEEGKNLRPDFQIHLPDNRLIIADSKVSMVAYNKFCESKNDEESQKYLDEHIKAVYNHVDDLSGKNYDDLEIRFSRQDIICKNENLKIHFKTNNSTIKDKAGILNLTFGGSIILANQFHK